MKADFFKNISKQYKTPHQLQSFLRRFPYNREERGETLRSAYQVFKKKKAHCLEAALFAAAVMQEKGYPPLLLCMDSSDNINHAVFIFKEKTGWGAIGRSREEGLHGRAPCFKSVQALLKSYRDPFVDKTGSLIGYHVIDLRNINSDWCFSSKNVWKVDRVIVGTRYKKFKTPKKIFLKLRQQYLKNGQIKSGKHWW